MGPIQPPLPSVGTGEGFVCPAFSSEESGPDWGLWVIDVIPAKYHLQSLRYGRAWLFFLILGLCAAREMHSHRARKSFWVLGTIMIGEYSVKKQDRWKGSLKTVLKSTRAYFHTSCGGTSSAGTTTIEARAERRRGLATLLVDAKDLPSCFHVPRITSITRAEKI